MIRLKWHLDNHIERMNRFGEKTYLSCKDHARADATNFIGSLADFVGSGERNKLFSKSIQ
jgi:hypothetical protein